MSVIEFNPFGRGARVAHHDEVGRVVAVHHLMGSNDLIEPWCVVRYADGGEVLHHHSELRAA